MKPDRQVAPYRLLGTFRLLLAMLVVLQHALPLLPQAVDGAVGPREVGSIAVYVFFTVSGFVIGEAATAFYAGRPGVFLGNRMLRLLPTFVLATCLAAAAARCAAALGDASAGAPAAYALRTVLINMAAILPIWRTVQAHWAVPELMVEVWAIRVEIVFYLVMAACLFGARLLRVTPRSLCAAAGLGVLVALMLMGGRAAGTLLENAPFFVLGVALFFALDKAGNRLLAGSFCVTACLFIASEMLGRGPTFGNGFMRDRAGEDWLLAGLLVGMGLLLFVRVGGPRWRRVRRFDKAAGDITYPLYLLHRPVLVVGAAVFPHGGWACAAVCVAAALGSSIAAAVFVEAPIARLRSRLRGRTLAEPAGPAPGAVPAPALP